MSKVDALIGHFEAASARMSDLPVFNTALSVSAVGFREYLNGDIGILVTPWCMNLIFLPGDAESELGGNSVLGEKRMIALPSGQYEFIWGESERLGGYLSCSLFSPMFEFDSQEIALETAEEVMRAAFDADNYAPTDRQIALHEQKQEAAEPKKKAEAQEPKGKPEKLSRRGFLTAGLSRGVTESNIHESI